MNFEKHVDREEDPRYVHKVDDRPLVVEVNEGPVRPKTVITYHIIIEMFGQNRKGCTAV